MDKYYQLMEDNILKNGANVAIIGCGIFGALTAIELSKKGNKVTIYESLKKILNGASLNNQNRLHLGFHYPRSDITAQQCIKTFQNFKSEFKASINENFQNAYFIASKGSLTSAKKYLSFCNRNNLNYETIDIKSFKPNIKNVSLGITTNEVVYDCKILRDLILKKLDECNIKIKKNCKINRVSFNYNKYKLYTLDNTFSDYDVLINSSYADINRLTKQLGYNIAEQQYEYTIVPIIEWKDIKKGITILDGKFMTILPYGKTNKFLLYHVKHSVYKTKIQQRLPLDWNTDNKSIIDLENQKYITSKMIKSCSEFVPDLIDAKFYSCLQGPRMVLKNHDHDDKRTSSLNEYGNNYFTIYSGKIDHAIEVSKKIANIV